MYTVNNLIEPQQDAALGEQTTEKLVELVRRHVFIYDVKSDKHRDGIRLQNVRESICMEMGVNGMDG